MAHVYRDEPEATTPSMLRPTSTNHHATRVMWRFLVKSLKEGWRVDFQNEEGEVIDSDKS